MVELGLSGVLFEVFGWAQHGIHAPANVAILARKTNTFPAESLGGPKNSSVFSLETVTQREGEEGNAVVRSFDGENVHHP
jgi:hypothetical protein